MIKNIKSSKIFTLCTERLSSPRCSAHTQKTKKEDEIYIYVYVCIEIYYFHAEALFRWTSVSTKETSATYTIRSYQLHCLSALLNNFSRFLKFKKFWITDTRWWSLKTLGKEGLVGPKPVRLEGVHLDKTAVGLYTSWFLM